MRTALIAALASLALAACGGDEDRNNATNDDSPQSTPTVAK
jgi:outer membrane biogenesis lipoprotein LolB